MIPGFSINYFLERDPELVPLAIYDLKNITTVAITPRDRADDFYIQQFIETIFPTTHK